MSGRYEKNITSFDRKRHDGLGAFLSRLGHLQSRSAFLDTGPAQGPIIATVDRFLSPRTCDQLVRIGRQHIATVAQEGDWAKPASYLGAWVSAVRHSAGGNDQLNQIFLRGRAAELVFHRLARLMHLPRSVFPPDLRMRTYRDIGCVWHLDSGRTAAATAVVYLNTLETERGGETAYRNEATGQIYAQFPPACGQLLIHSNLGADGHLIETVTHCSQPARGEKFILSIPIRLSPVPTRLRESDYSAM